MFIIPWEKGFSIMFLSEVCMNIDYSTISSVIIFFTTKT